MKNICCLWSNSHNWLASMELDCKVSLWRNVIRKWIQTKSFIKRNSKEISRKQSIAKCSNTSQSTDIYKRSVKVSWVFQFHIHLTKRTNLTLDIYKTKNNVNYSITWEPLIRSEENKPLLFQNLDYQKKKGWSNANGFMHLTLVPI